MSTVRAQPGELAAYLNGNAPLAVRSVELRTEPCEIRLPPSLGGPAYKEVAVLLREQGQPLGWTTLNTSEGTIPAQHVAALREMVGLAARETDGARRDGGPQASAQSLLSVVVATCDDDRATISCVEAILETDTAPLEVIVVENRPGCAKVKGALASAFPGERRVRYVEEPRPGLSAARNRGLAEACGALIAFTDDDVIVDGEWIPAIRAAFASMPGLGCVTGLILPYELETPAQLLVERFASFGKGFRPRLYSIAEPPCDQPLFPYSAGYFASGANMAFRTSVLREIGGFDAVLGTGTHARGGEDLDVCIRLLQAGRALAYEPRAIVWHRHPDSEPRLRRQVFDYGTSLGAMLTKQLVTGPDRLRMISRAPRALRYFIHPDSRKNAGRGASFPRTLSLLERLGLCYGPVAYAISRLAGRS